MGILKFAAKAAGTIALTALGTASAVGQSIVGVAGKGDIADGLTDMLGRGKSASFDAIHDLWSEGRTDEDSDRPQFDNVSFARTMTSNSAKRCAEQWKAMAKKYEAQGNMARYNECMQKYEAYMDKYYELKE